MLAPVEHGRDPRPMNSMTPEVRHAHGFLLVWGRWNRDSGVRAWPRRTVLGRVMDEGPDGALISSRAPISDPPPDVEVLERIVLKLCETDRRVLRVEYVEPWCMRDAKARMANMRPGKYKRTLDRARWRVHFGLQLTEGFAVDSKAA